MHFVKFLFWWQSAATLNETFCFNLGGKNKQADAINQQAAAIPPPIPPVSSSAADIQAVGRQTKIAQSRRKGGASTVLAGLAGNGADTGFGGKTLLGSQTR
jgi:hypothetical protein